MKKHTNPTAQKIIDLGGVVLSEPLTTEDGEINPKCAEQLFAELERRPLGERIRSFLKGKSNEN